MNERENFPLEKKDFPINHSFNFCHICIQPPTLSIYRERNTPLMEILRVEKMDHTLVPVLCCFLLISTALANSGEEPTSKTFTMFQASLSRSPHDFGHNTAPGNRRPPPPRKSHNAAYGKYVYELPPPAQRN
ncbi:hypothetical protein HanIR_Chr04g0163871 [Helianthus annuus]|nr:hypothetical protein HanIR_Chr04g0163871 [Helianthus annuus]